VRLYGVGPRVPQKRIAGLLGPVIGLVEIATKTAIDQIVEGVRAASNPRTIVVDGQRPGAISFRYATILTGVVRPKADLLHGLGR
jgi:hypothetical protein